MSWFDEEDDDIQQEEYVAPKGNHVGKTYGSWTILAKIDGPGHLYKMQCSCGKTFERRISPVLTGRSSGCILCSKKVHKNRPYLSVAKRKR